MTVPRATYRLQFRNGMDFDRAAALAPYLARLGISHLYASPIFAATKGSTHGYDIVDYNEIDPALGGMTGFERLNTALRREGLGLILDIVPNHMAASLENAWWRSVVEWGSDSPYRDHFDIDWSRKLTLPILGRPYDEALKLGELVLRRDTSRGTPVIGYFNNDLPLQPDSYPESVQQCQDRAAIDALLGRQPWRLMHWRDASRHLSYRRFFEIAGLVGVRVEDEKVFADVHRLTLQLVRAGLVDGLRIDHVDGLADPRAYLERLRAEAGPDCYIVVEKILAAAERLPADWPVQGTTGYEFIADMAGLFVDPQGTAALGRHYEEAIGGPADVEAERAAAKRLLLRENFAGELSTLVAIAGSLHATDALETATAELIVALPVYRTYGDAAGLPARDEALIGKLRDGLSGKADGEALEFITRLLAGEVPQEWQGKAAEFRRRFQQLTGPIMAKAVEDTLFYRFNRFLPLNEVGGDPELSIKPIEAFHDRMAERTEVQPHGFFATATHDTKRGEDARARLYALSEAPGRWGDAVARWRARHRRLVRDLPDGPAPDADTEWMLYQAMAGMWPSEIDIGDGDALQRLSQRFQGYVEKALREAKRRTSWIDVNRPYEEAVKAYADQLFAPSNEAFLRDFADMLRPFIRAGALNSLAQTLIKLTAPGVPDIYQGTEGEDLNLVDPDNRRAVDFEALAATLAGATRAKQHLIAVCLDYRRAHPALFAEGSYIPLAVGGEMSRHVIAFGRNLGRHRALTVVPRLTLGLPGGGVSINPEVWKDTWISLPESFPGYGLVNLLGPNPMSLANPVPVRSILAVFPVALAGTT